ncbi:hypothetical protein C0033_18765 [Clostridium sp. chh4-2]|nr:hypothetical protein C0033_18765 [Clostridium sp. chh4-2]
MPSGFTLNVKAFREKPSPFTLNPQSISKNPFTLDVNLTHAPNLFYPQPAKHQPERRGNLGGRRKWKQIGDRVQTLSDTWTARAEKGRQILNSESVFEAPLNDEVIKSSS